jgi:hypothetical protein
MAIVKPGRGRAVIEQDGTGLRITVPVKAQVFVTLFLAFWLMGWAVGEVMVSYHLVGGRYSSGARSIIMIAWLGAWTVGGAWIASALLWNIAGKEIIELNSTTLKRRKQIPVFSRSKEYAVASIANLRLAPALPSFFGYYRQNMSFLTFNEGAISFDYGRDTRHLATGLDEADAKYVIGEMCKRVKSLCQ